jgi:hypothetical protein
VVEPELVEHPGRPRRWSPFRELTARERELLAPVAESRNRDEPPDSLRTGVVTALLRDDTPVIPGEVLQAPTIPPRPKRMGIPRAPRRSLHSLAFGNGTGGGDRGRSALIRPACRFGLRATVPDRGWHTSSAPAAAGVGTASDWLVAVVCLGLAGVGSGWWRALLPGTACDCTMRLWAMGRHCCCILVRAAMPSFGGRLDM